MSAAVTAHRAARPATGTWSSDNPAVATVTQTGIVTGVASGDSSIIFDSGGVRGSKRIRVSPNYNGRWSGEYSITGCTQSGEVASANICGLLGSGSRFPYMLTVSQTA